MNLFRVLAGSLAGTLLLYAYLKHNKTQAYKQLEAQQQDIIRNYQEKIAVPKSHDVPNFGEHFATISDFLPKNNFNNLKEAVVKLTKTERTYLPGHKQGGTISYEELHHVAPEVIALYQSHHLRAVLSQIIGQAVQPTPLNDQSSCSVLSYTKEGDHIGWHFDHNFYNGRHFTVLLPIVNEKNDGTGLSSCKLIIRKGQDEVIVSTAPNTLVMFEGAKVQHRTTKLGAQETRILLSMTFCTDCSTSVMKDYIRRVKDTAFFGIRALWT